MSIPPSLFLTKEQEEEEDTLKESNRIFDKAELVGDACCLASVVAHTKEINDLKFSPNDAVRVPCPVKTQAFDLKDLGLQIKQNLLDL